ncbi:MAG: cysteine desulfurase family protein [Pseudomonadota bacterium]
MLGLPDIAPVYLDYAASTPVDSDVAAFMQQCLLDAHAQANPSSQGHQFGAAANCYIVDSAVNLATALGVQPESIVWTSGATESDNLAIFGVARYYADRGKHLITSRIEHKAVLDAFTQLEAEGFDVTWLTPDAEGRISADQVANALRDDTTLVSLMWVNNELGTINPIADIAAVVAPHNALLHVDAAQAFGKLPVDIGAIPVDLASVTAHKCYGPKGVGALYVAQRHGVNIQPMLFGGGQQGGLRPGTLPTHQIAGFGAAARKVAEQLAADQAHIAPLAAQLLERLLAVPGVTLNGSATNRLPAIINVSVQGISGDALFACMAPIALATGSACNSMLAEPSFVLKALGRSDREAEASLRFSLGRHTSAADIDMAAERFCASVERLRAIAGPLTAFGAAATA